MKGSIRDEFGDEAARSAPYDFYDTLRSDEPIFYSEYLKAYVITRFADARHVLDNPALFSSRPPTNQTNALAKYATAYLTMYEEAGVPPPMPTLVSTDGLEHKRYRSIVDPTFAAGAVRKLDAMVAKIIDDLLDDFIDLGEVDLYRDFCLKLPLYMICDMLGLPRTGASVMQRAADSSVRLAIGAAESADALRACHADIVAAQVYLLDFVTSARRERPDNLLGHLVGSPCNDGTMLDDREVLSILQILNVGGNETTTNGLGNMFEKLLNDPALEARLRADRAAIPRFVEEAVRVESPVAGMPRFATCDTEIDGFPIPAGANLQVRFSAANRDEHQFACPAHIDLARSGIRNHVAFGSGPHYCLGAPLARLELKAALEHVFDRIAAMWLDPAKTPPRYGTRLQVRGVASLPIRFRKHSEHDVDRLATAS